MRRDLRSGLTVRPQAAARTRLVDGLARRWTRRSRPENQLLRICSVAVLLGCIALLQIGCGGSGQGESSTTAGQSSDGTPVVLTGPAATVQAFLEGARRGDDKAVQAMLTATARTKMAEYKLPVAPPASDTSRFELGEVQLSNDQVARVACRWIENNLETGESSSSEATYFLRKEPEGWRIAGIARIAFPNEPPLLLNYEDPEDMLRQAQMLAEERARRAQPAPESDTARAPQSQEAQQQR